MAEVWIGAAITVGGAVVGGVAKSKQAKQDRKNNLADSKAMNEDEAKWMSIQSQFEAEQEHRYEQIKRRDKQRGLEQFRQFSTINQFAPEYVSSNREIEVPDQRSIGQIADEHDKKTAETTGNPQTFGGKNKKSTWQKIDPLGSKLLGGLF